MNKQFDWSLIPSFLAVLNEGSLLGAAKALNASQPTLGRHMFELESQLGTVLFERTGRGLVPTSMALQLADTARAMESSAMQLTRHVVGAQSAIAGSVRISASQPVACILLPPLLANMRVALPDVCIELVVSNDLSNLLAREADIALRMVQPEQGGVIAKRVGKIAIGAYAHRSYLEKRGFPKKPQDLLQHDLIGSDKSGDFERGAGALNLTAPPERVVFRSDDLIAQVAAIRAGLGVGFISDYAARYENSFVPLLPMLQIPALSLWLVVHKEVKSNPRIKSVFTFLAEHLPKIL